MAISSNATGLRPGVCTSTTRPTNPYTGQIIYETDTGYLRVWDGAAWDYLSQSQNAAPITWQDWTPTFLPESGVWYVAPTIYARYARIGNFIYGEALHTITSFGTASGHVSFALPVVAKQGNPAALGCGRESSLTGQTFNVWRVGTSNGVIRFYNNAATAGANHSFPFNFFYEAA